MATPALSSQVAAKWQDAFAKLNQEQPGIVGLLEFSKAWTLATEYLRPRDLRGAPARVYTREHAEAMEMVNQCRRLPALLEVFLEDMRKSWYIIKGEVVGFMAQYEVNSDPQVIKQLVYRLAGWHRMWSPPKDLGVTIRTAYTLAFQTELFASLPASFTPGFKALVASTLPPLSSPPPENRAAATATASATTDTASATTVTAPVTTATDSTTAIAADAAFAPGSHFMVSAREHATTWGAFRVLGFVDRFETLIASVAYEHIEAYVVLMCLGKWQEPMLERLRHWMAHRIVPWMVSPYASMATTFEEAKALLQSVGSRFDFQMNKTLCDLRTKEIFDIIVDYPDSMGALQDIKECLQRVDQRTSLVQSLRSANQKRLLHPGADTKDILLQYVQTIRCLRIIDPPGVLLFKVADPIRRYLRERPDTIRNIVASLVGDGDGDSLVDENEPIQPLQHSEVENYADPNWQPEPIDAGPDFRANKPSDIISTLVSIYDSKDLFVKELQVLLAQRLLAIRDGKFEKERRNIEILKVRFGETALQVCEVMLKDMTDSRRTDDHVQSQRSSVVHPTIISRHFWPALEASDIALPGQFQVLLEQYSKEFSKFKPDKRLRWLPHLGTVQLELHLQDRVVQADVPPLEAAFIELFSEQDVWTLDELIKGVGSVDRTAALKALLTWVDLGVLKEDTENSFRLLEVAEEATAGARASGRSGLMAEEPPAAAAAHQQQAEQMQVYWKFIEGMLTNLGALPLNQIQTMLKFAPGYNRNIDQLAAFMEAARREGLVTGKDGVWRLSKP